jgi:hypothetical protein
MDKEDKGGLISMNTNKLIMVVMAAILIIAAVIIGFMAVDNRPAQIHPVGPMIGDEQIHPHGTRSPGVAMMPMDEMIYVPAYPDEECTAEDRILIDTPIRVVDADGTVYRHWLYENSSTARNR